jgi:hypothetical protein
MPRGSVYSLSKRLAALLLLIMFVAIAQPGLQMQVQRLQDRQDQNDHQIAINTAKLSELIEGRILDRAARIEATIDLEMKIALGIMGGIGVLGAFALRSLKHIRHAQYQTINAQKNITEVQSQLVDYMRQIYGLEGRVESLEEKIGLLEKHMITLSEAVREIPCVSGDKTEAPPNCPAEA